MAARGGDAQISVREVTQSPRKSKAKIEKAAERTTGYRKLAFRKSEAVQTGT